MTGALDGLRVLDLSRILAGPSATQLLGDLGADVIKVERPGTGDDTRGWGPPFTPAGDATYYLAANRNKRSIAIDLSREEGVVLVRDLALASDVLVENFKAGDLARRGLGYAELAAREPRLVYCSITGFGQTGPRAAEPGYDFLAQAMGGLMSLTGEPDGAPMKVGVGIADLFAGLHGAVAILAALRHRDRTGEGQHLDLALFDTQLATLANAATAFLATGKPPGRHGNAHPHIVPYEAFRTADGFVVLAVGNDAQFERFARVAGLAPDARFATNAARVENRTAIVHAVAKAMLERTTEEWLVLLGEAGVPCGPVNDLSAAFRDSQSVARAMIVQVEGARLVANPIKATRTPPTYRRSPPALGAHGREILVEVLGLSTERIEQLERSGVLGTFSRPNSPL